MEKLKYILKDVEPEEELQRLRMILASKCKARRTKDARRNRYLNNKMFRENQKSFYSKLRGQSSRIVSDPPTKEEMDTFWKGIWDDNQPHNDEAGWVKAETEAMENIKRD